MGEKSKGNKSIFIIIALIIIIIALIAYIVFACKSKPQNSIVAENKGLLVLDDITIEDEDSKMVVLKVKNTSSKTFTNVTPVLIYYDADNMPIHEAWGTRISYFASGETRYVEYYDTIEEYSKVEVGLFDREDVGIEYKDLRDKISYEVEKAEEPDEDGEIRLTFKGENKFDKDVELEFQIAYYSGDKLIYEDQFGTLVEANSKFEEYEYYATKFANGTAFPEGYTYEVTLTEAVEYVDETEELDYEEDATQESSDIDVESLSDEEKIEHILFKEFKKVYGDKLASAKIYIDKMYTPEEVEKNEVLKSLDIKKDEIAFEATIDFEPAEGADPKEFMIPNGEYNKENGWVSNATRIGILTKDAKSEDGYTIRSLGTGW